MKPVPEEYRGVLAWFAQNKVAANLLMALVLVGGALFMTRMNQEVFPELDTGIITVQVPYLGGTPEDVEIGVNKKIEEEVSGIDGVKRVTSSAAEGLGVVTIEMEDYVDQRRVLSDVEAAVDRIDTFPGETEKPVVAEKTNRVQVVSVVLYGDVPERTLKELAERMRDDLTKLDNISTIELQGVRRYEISIEVSEEALRKYGLSFREVADAVAGSSLDLPGGSIKTPGGQRTLRVKAQRYNARDFEDVVVLTRTDGSVLRLHQVAEVIDGFEDDDMTSYFDGQRAAILNVYRVGEQDAIDVADTIKEYVDEVRHTMPAGVSVDTWFDRSVFLTQRIDLLTRNAFYGIVMVFLALALFLDLKLAFWTMMGIPISFMGAFWLLPVFGVSINMISLFAFIVVLGIVVDDAIVVGENIFAHRQRGDDGLTAAIRGAREMAAPVTFAIATTIVAFLPLLFTSGEIGKIMTVIPIVVISVLLISLVEALLILPAHLSDPVKRHDEHRGPIAWVQRQVRQGLNWVIHKSYVPSVRFCVRYRYLTLTAAVMLLTVTVGFIAGGHIKFRFFPKIDADNILAVIEMPQGTPVDQTAAVVKRVEAAAERVRQHYDLASVPGAPSIVTHVNTTVGRQPFGRLVAGQGSSGDLSGGESHLAEINVEIQSGETRTITATEFANRWREEAGQIAGVNSLVFSTELMSAGEPIHIELAAADDTEAAFQRLLHAVEALKERLGGYAGVFDIDDSFVMGKVEDRVVLTEEGKTLGLSERDVALQVRQGFYGAEVQRVQRGRDDVRVMVRYPEDDRRTVAQLENMRIRLEDGTEVPFGEVARIETGRGYSGIARADKRRVVSITADIDTSITTANEINAELAADVIPAVLAEYPGVTWRFEGAQREQGESMGSLLVGFAIAMFGIYALLGIQFKSYIQPAIVMSAIPFGLVGAVAGHVLLGFDLSFLSGFGVVALTGVVVNDSLIMIDVINNMRGEGRPMKKIITEAGIKRFRPILLTTLTTFCGLTPMLLEKSIQAKFLVPMAVSLAFGVLFATVITLVLVPTLYVIIEDVKRLVVYGTLVDVDHVHEEADAEWAERIPGQAHAPDPDEPIVESDAEPAPPPLPPREGRWLPE